MLLPETYNIIPTDTKYSLVILFRAFSYEIYFKRTDFICLLIILFSIKFDQGTKKSLWKFLSTYGSSIEKIPSLYKTSKSNNIICQVITVKIVFKETCRIRLKLSNALLIPLVLKQVFQASNTLVNHISYTKKILNNLNRVRELTLSRIKQMNNVIFKT